MYLNPHAKNNKSKNHGYFSRKCCFRQFRAQKATRLHICLCFTVSLALLAFLLHDLLVETLKIIKVVSRKLALLKKLSSLNCLDQDCKPNYIWINSDISGLNWMYGLHCITTLSLAVGVSMDANRGYCYVHIPGPCVWWAHSQVRCKSQHHQLG